MMRRYALFVEGYTEAAFCERLLAEIAGHNNAQIVHQRLIGRGQYSPIRESVFTITDASPARYHFLILNCGSDDTVLSAILDRLPGLSKAGYRVIVGLRDLYPKPSTELSTIREKIRNRLRESPIPCRVVFAIREIEAWFLAEAEHFRTIHCELTPEAIQAGTGVDILGTNLETIPHPSAVLQTAYQLVGKRYIKGEHKSRQTVDALDYENLYLHCQTQLPSLAEFCHEIDDMLSPDRE